MLLSPVVLHLRFADKLPGNYLKAGYSVWVKVEVLQDCNLVVPKQLVLLCLIVDGSVDGVALPSVQELCASDAFVVKGVASLIWTFDGRALQVTSPHYVARFVGVRCGVVLLPACIPLPLVPQFIVGGVVVAVAVLSGVVWTVEGFSSMLHAKYLRIALCV